MYQSFYRPNTPNSKTSTVETLVIEIIVDKTYGGRNWHILFIYFLNLFISPILKAFLWVRAVS